ncbi:aspartyl/asparaginyl beta-hydroxylase domain-containing protein [Burkholderia sp. Bp9142]|uniref:aspartyl/asparaginyl beta-hydroxylase domain-containing protein n=1 Tax=Burkholderia sp. Bp9142 TaxID=2184573 RepID=UPI000F5A258D|nr:aspartyl/asparaginyl beta-hydroxylase domain-containing protein [Burkholderia sp. Bp9142]RQR40636.1 aspartyl/asparaginyl beta-hydroxylase domain-containing protein [Burkholderia sp. Bp9142]
MNQWIPDALSSLEAWTAEKGIERQSIRRILDGLAITARDEIAGHARCQRPKVYFPDLATREWWDREEFSWSEAIEFAAPRILEELESAGGVEMGETEDSSKVLGRWSVRYLSCMGRPDRENAKAFPMTLQALAPISGATSAGMTYFSVIAGGTHILPHYGFTNAHLRCHLPLVTNERSRIRVGEEIRTWRRNEVSIFDDTFEHEVWNEAEEPRVILLFDIFHPALSGFEVDALTLVMRTIRQHHMRPHWRSLLTGLAPGKIPDDDQSVPKY